jgi:effector-binding domain-containing protein
MKIFRILLIVIGVIIGAVLITTVFLPAKYSVQRITTFKEAPYVVYYQFATFKYWEKWDAWMEMDPNQKRTYSGPMYGKGSSYSWVSTNQDVGKGSMTMTEAIPLKEISLELEMVGMSEKMNGTIKFENINGFTKVIWTMHGNMNGFGKWFGVFADYLLGRSFDKSFANIEKVISSLPLTKAQITTTTILSNKILYITDSTSAQAQDISAKLGKAYSEIMEFAGKNKLVCKGAPLVINLKYDVKGYVFQAGIPYEYGNITTEGRIKTGNTPGGNVVKAIQIGPYEMTTSTYEKIMKYIADNKLEINGLSFEVYMNDPALVLPMDLLTEIYFPVK